MRVGRRGCIVVALAVLAGVALSLGLRWQPAQAQNSCIELITNGGFEGTGGWIFGLDPAQPQYVANPLHSGTRALQLGIPSGVPNQRSYSSVRQQVVIPANAAQVTLAFWYMAIMPGAPTTDYVEMALLGPDGRNLLDKPWRSFVDNRVWNQAAFDLTAWHGQTVQIYFNVFNDGAGPSAAMYLDDVSLQACGSSPAPGSVTPTTSATASPLPTVTLTPYPTPLPTWTLTPGVISISPTPTSTSTPTNTPAPAVITPTPTNTVIFPIVTPTNTPAYPPTALPPPGPLPTVGPPAPGCVDLVRNGDFEQGTAYWHLAPNKLPVVLVGPPSVLNGNYAVRLGTMETAGVESYSSIRQPVYIPPGYAQVLLTFYTWTWAEANAGSDHQEADFLAPDPAVLQKFWRVLSNDQSWQLHSIPVTAYAGRSVVLYFNVYNQGAGGRAAMFLDAVHMWACPGTFISPLASMGGGGFVQPQAQPPQPQPQPAPPQRAPAAAAPTVTPVMTVLSLLITPTPGPVIGFGYRPVATAQPQITATATVQPGPLDQLIRTIRNRTPPAWWQWLIIIGVGLLLLWAIYRILRP